MQVKELAASYERPVEVECWYFQDVNRLSNVEAMVLEANVADYVFSHAKVTEKTLSFDELMSAGLHAYFFSMHHNCCSSVINRG